jgi:DNA anti-recombination protein RmuC
MPDRPPSAPPALSDVALRETLDLLGQVVASMSARIDKQGEQIEAIAKAVEKTRGAAKRTEQQTDPAAYARFIGTEVENALDKVLDEFAGAVLTIRRDHETTAARLKELEQAEEAALEHLRQEIDAAARWRRQVPWVWAGAVSTAIVLTAVLKGLV